MRTQQPKLSAELRRIKRRILSRSSPVNLCRLRSQSTNSRWRLTTKELLAAWSWQWSCQRFAPCQSASWESPRLVVTHSLDQLESATLQSNVCQCTVGCHKKYNYHFPHLWVKQCAECIFSPQDDVLLEVEDVYYLLLEFPKTVIEDTASAIFNKKKRMLTLRLDVDVFWPFAFMEKQMHTVVLGMCWRNWEAKSEFWNWESSKYITKTN